MKFHREWLVDTSPATCKVDARCLEPQRRLDVAEFGPQRLQRFGRLMPGGLSFAALFLMPNLHNQEQA